MTRNGMINHNSNQKVFVIDSNNENLFKDVDNDLCFLWSSFSNNRSNNFVSLPDYIELYSDRLRAQYINFIESISLNFSGKKFDSKKLIWNMSLIMEKSNFSKSKYISDIVKIFAFIELTKDLKIAEIEVISDNENLINLFRDWSKFKKILFLSNCDKSNFITKIGKSIKESTFFEFTKGLFSLLKYYRHRNRLKQLTKTNANRQVYDATIVSYITNLDDFSQSLDDAISRYWGEFYKNLKKEKRKILWIFLLSGNINKSVIQKFLDKEHFDGIDTSHFEYQFIDSFLSLKLLFKVILEYIYTSFTNLTFKKGNLFYKYNFDLWRFYQQDWNSSLHGSCLANNILYKNLFLTLFSNKQIFGNVIYPLENISWEFALIDICRRKNIKKIIGFPHTDIRFWDLRYFRTINKESQKFYPDLLISTSKKISDNLVYFGFKKKQLIKMHPLRFQEISPKVKKDPKNKTSNKLILLILGDYEKKNDLIMLERLIKNNKSLLSNKKVVFKPHPTQKNLSYLNSYIHGKYFKIVDLKISELIANCDIVISSQSTTASIPFAMKSIPVGIFVDGVGLNLSPFKGMNYKNPFEIKSKDDFDFFMSNFKQFREEVELDYYRDKNWSKLLN